MSELFPDQAMAAQSPRLLWLKHHNLALGELPDGQRVCYCETSAVCADTHSDAELKMAGMLEIEHWTIEVARRAGVTMVEKAVIENWD